jgi:hypothetical protein
MNIKKSFFFILVILSFSSVFSQSDSSSRFNKNEKISINKYDSSKERDLADVIHSFSKKKHVDSTRNTAIKKYHLSFVPALGYTLQTGFAGIASANIAYRTDNNPETKLSSITTSFTYSQYNQTIIPLQADIWTKNNKYNIVSDNRFIQYPSDIYGLGRVKINGLVGDPYGGGANPNKGITIDFLGLKLHETILKTVNKDLYIGVGLYYDQFWNISAIDSLKQKQNIRLTQTLGTREVASGLALKVLYDNRLNQINSTNGWYANLVYRPNFTFMGSQTNWQSLLIDVRKYITLPNNSKNVLAFWSLDWLTTSGTPPYLLLPSTGWDDQYNTGRGYIQGRFRGDNMYYLESEYRFRISRNGLLGGVVFANAEKFSGEISKQFKTIAPGAGLGLRLKLNKFSGANLCVDYGFGENGSRGFFVNLGEVF